ncbi:flagellar FlbD family protein [Indiicoccus explosivorum]|uniref:flagellar FlbD family protein n=1 Tax=Indiicoccus explosivorum TaxID=1917864 RepID=UPI000B451CD6|nr:flagellar FlbD family protein [Indiicoccus explosivorum]
MIHLTKLNGKPFYLNALYIETVEEFPDTTISLTDGKKYIVLEKSAEVAKKIESFYRSVQLMPQAGGEET